MDICIQVKVQVILLFFTFIIYGNSSKLVPWGKPMSVVLCNFLKWEQFLVVHLIHSEPKQWDSLSSWNFRKSGDIAIIIAAICLSLSHPSYNLFYRDIIKRGDNYPITRSNYLKLIRSMLTSIFKTGEEQLYQDI